MTNEEALKITNNKIEHYDRMVTIGNPTLNKRENLSLIKSAKAKLEYYGHIRKALLNVQVPAKPQKYPNYVQEINGKQVITYDYKCGKCGNKIYGYYVCCPYCTTMINWVDDGTIEQVMSKPMD